MGTSCSNLFIWNNQVDWHRPQGPW
jgi:hypothetical protein